MSKNGVSYKGTISSQGALAHLENLVRSLKTGSACVQVEKDHVVLKLDQASPVSMEIGAASKKGKNRFSLELSWEDPKQGAERTPAMIISTRAPEPDPAPVKPVQAPAAPKAPAPAPAQAKKKVAAKKTGSAPKKAAAAPRKAAKTAPKTAAKAAPKKKPARKKA
jgi:amphi-Trp domain-containing protein